MEKEKKPIMIYAGGVGTLQSILEANKDKLDVMMFVEYDSALRVMELFPEHVRNRIAILAAEDEVSKQPNLKVVEGKPFTIFEDDEI